MKTTTLILILAVASLSGLSIASKPSPYPSPTGAKSAALLPVDPLLERLREIPPEQFFDLPSLQSWANTTTTGGGTVQTLQAGEDIEVAIAFRSHTSRYESSDAIIYSRHRRNEKGPWQLLTYRQPVFRDLIKATVSEDRLHLRSVASGQTLLELLLRGSLRPFRPLRFARSTFSATFLLRLPGRSGG